MSATIRTAVKQAIGTFQASIMAEIHSLQAAIVALTTRVVQLEKELNSLSTICTDFTLKNRPPPQVTPSYVSCVKTVDQEELLQLQSQVQSITTQQRKITEEREEKM